MIEHDEICALIPHEAGMCLLDRVVSWDEDTIICESATHRSETNPLRSGDGLSSISLIEYGAQAMAVHGGLLTRYNAGEAWGGYLAAVREVTMVRRDIARADDTLVINAKKLMAQQGSMIYQFEIYLDKVSVIRGRATVVAVRKADAE